MLVEIVKDAMSVITKECTEEQAAAYAANFVVNVVNEDGTKTPYGVAPAEPAAESEKAAKKAKK